MASWIPRTRRGWFRLLLATLVVAAAAWATVRPSHDRVWIPEHSRLPQAIFHGSQVEIRSIRDFRYENRSPSRQTWYDRTFDLDSIESLWFVLSPFRDDWRGPAHSLLSFGFADGSFLAISVEARKEPGEIYSVWKGMIKRYELLYVIADERDVIGLRVFEFDDDVLVYPIRAQPQAMRTLLIEMLEKANALREEPEFYHTVFNNCTTNLQRHVNRVAPEEFGPSWKILLPGYADELVYQRGLLDTELDLDAARQAFRVNDRARTVRLEDKNFSAAIRQQAAVETGP